MSDPSGPAPLPAELEHRLRADAAAGALKSLSHYLRESGDREEEVARLYLSLCPAGAGTRGFAGGPLGDRLGPFRLLRELGRGGQGQVHLAEDTRLGRRVALKLLTALGEVPEPVLRRFRREAEVASRLDHPGICGIHETGIIDGVPYISMRYVEGETLGTRLSRARTSTDDEATSIIEFGGGTATEEAEAGPAPGADAAAPDRRAVMAVVGLFEKVARALHAAHEAGIVHRDVKPANIMITPDEEPVLLDFGLARDDEGDLPSLTRSGDLFGTPVYMSPEQLMARRIPLDRRTDVWSLGVALYECLTLERPFDAPTREALYRAIMTKEARDPRRINPAIPADLKVVIETALEKDRDRRYLTALELAQDLRRIRCYEPIRARPIGRLLRLRRWMQRNPTLAVGGLAAAILLVVTTGLLSYGVGERERARLAGELRRRAEADRDAAESARHRLVRAQRDAAFRRGAEEITAEIGVVTYGVPGRKDYEPLLRRFLALLREHGFALDGSLDEQALRAAVTGWHRRHPAEPQVLGTVLSDFASLSRQVLRQTGAAADEGERALAEEVTGILQRLDVCFAALADPWTRRVLEVERAWLTRGEDGFGGLFDEAEAREPDGAVGFLAAIAFQVPAWRERSLATFDAALRIDPGDYSLQFARGGCELVRLTEGTGDPRVAARHLEIAVALRPRSGLTRAVLASALALDGRPEEALAQLDRAVALAPDSALAWFFKGLFHLRAGQPEPARAALDRCLAIDPEFANARAARAKLGQ